MRADGWLARIFQHEIDHLDGILFTDKADEVWEPDEEYVDSV
jgi:peptide deformylase